MGVIELVVLLVPSEAMDEHIVGFGSRQVSIYNLRSRRGGVNVHVA